MLLTQGRLPRQNLFRCNGRCRPSQTFFSVWLLVCLLAATGAGAQQTGPLTLAEAEDIALDLEPGQAAYLARADALAEESVAAGQLPDPSLRVGLANFPVQSGGFTTEGMTQAQLGIRQALPRRAARAASTRRFQSMSLEMKESAEGRGRDVLTSVRQAWLDVYFWQRTHAIVDQSRPLFSDLVTVTRSMYSVGRKDQQDLLRAELELGRLDDRLIEVEKQHDRAIAALSEWVGGDAVRPVALELPHWQQVPSMAVLQANLPSHPAVKAADARIDARQAGIDLAEAQFKPGWAVDLGYGYRDGYLSDGRARSDFVSLSVTMDLPFFTRNRQDRKLASALSERRAAKESKEQLLRRLSSRLEAEYAEWHELNRRIDLYEQKILTLAGSSAQAALAAYQSDAGDFADVMRATIDDLDTRVDHIRLLAERAQSFATLANLGGIRQ